MGDQAEVDLVKRDPNDLNDYVKVSFEEVLGEPDSAHAWDGIWSCSFKCFNCTLGICYKILTAICGCPIAFMWGIQFACIACKHIYCMTPCLRMCQIEAVFCQKYLSACFSVFLTPFCESCGRFFSQITVKNTS